MKNLIIDGQILQTNAWHRGMGKYTLRVLQEFNDKSLEDLQIYLLLNNSIETEESRFATISYLLPNIKLLRWDLPIASDKKSEETDYTKKLDEYINNNFSESENYYFVTSLFTFDFFANFPSNCYKLLLFYDLTPLLFWKDLGGYFPPDLYMPRFKKLYEADKIFCISATTRGDLLNIFGLDPSRLVNINGGFTQIAKVTKRPKSFTVPSRYILFPSGDLPHKNNDVAIKGYEEYRLLANSDLPILITSYFQPANKKRLSLISEKVVFTGNVSDEELEWLYEHAEAILFASKYEGLGMPVLDAVANKKPIIASKIPVFKEMSKDAFYFFDVNNPDELAIAFMDAQYRKAFNQKLKNYSEIMRKYTWKNTVQTLRSSILTTTKHEGAEDTYKKPLLAVLCLHPGIKGQIGREVEALHYNLSREFEVHYYFDANGKHYTDMERPSFLDYMGIKTYDINKFNLKAYQQYKATVYMVDHYAIPSRVAQRACIFPGIAIVGPTGVLSDADELFMEAIVDNQYAIYRLEKKNYESYQKLTSLIDEAMKEKILPSNRFQKMLKMKGSERSIIKQMRKSQ